MTPPSAEPEKCPWGIKDCPCEGHREAHSTPTAPRGHEFDCEINNGLEKPCTCGYEVDIVPSEWIYEDELPEGYPYTAMFPFSRVDGVRMFPANPENFRAAAPAVAPTPPAPTLGKQCEAAVQKLMGWCDCGGEGCDLCRIAKLVTKLWMDRVSMSKREITNAEELAAACAADGISLPVAAAPAVAPTPQPKPATMLGALKRWTEDVGGEISASEGSAFMDGWQAHVESVAGGAVAETPQPKYEVPKCDSTTVNYPGTHDADWDEAEPDKCKWCGGYHRGGCHKEPSKAAPQPSDERAAFEEWAISANMVHPTRPAFKRDRTGEYMRIAVEYMWRGWAARASQERKP